MISSRCRAISRSTSSWKSAQPKAPWKGVPGGACEHWCLPKLTWLGGRRRLCSELALAEVGVPPRQAIFMCGHGRQPGPKPGQWRPEWRAVSAAGLAAGSPSQPSDTRARCVGCSGPAFTDTLPARCVVSSRLVWPSVHLRLWLPLPQLLGLSRTRRGPRGRPEGWCTALPRRFETGGRWARLRGCSPPRRTLLPCRL